MLKKLLFNLSILTLVGGFAFAQQSVSGKIIDNSTGEPVPGVSVLVKGTTSGTASDVDGNYQIDISEPNPTLIFSSIGYTSQEVIVGNKSVIDIGLIVDVQALEEVVVIGYGTREKKDLTGAVAQINSDVIARTTALTPELAMQGTMPGVFVSQSSGDPSSRPTVRIRGIGTWGYAEPLYVIDGIPVAEAFQESAELDLALGGGGSRNADLRGNQNILNTINPADIESITVLKDASAAAIYGVRAANGVVIITTKKGTSGAPKVTFNASFGVQKLTDQIDVLGTPEYAALQTEIIQNAGLDINDPLYKWYNPSDPAYQGNSSVNEDWQGYAKEDGRVQDYSLAISGGNQASQYYTSFGYSEQTAAMKWNTPERYNITLNSEHEVTDWLKIGQNFRYTNIKADNANELQSLQSMSTRQPWQPIFDPTNVFGFAPAVQDIYGPSTDANPFGERAAGDYSIFKTNRILGNAYAEIRPIEGLRVRGTVHFDLTNIKRESLATKAAQQFQITPRPGSRYGERVVTTQNIQQEILVGYNRSFGDHNFDLTLNGSWQEIAEEAVFASADDNPVDGIPIIDEASSSGGGAKNDNALIGYLARLSYNFAGKYYVDASVRRDGTSRFAEDFRWGTFPAVAAAWRISSEQFLQGSSFINDLKLRAGWGQLGNQVTASYQFLSLATLSPKYLSGGNDASQDNSLAQLGAFFPALPNVGITWETVTTTNVGFDALMLDNKLSLTVEYYKRETEDILQTVAIPTVAGYQSSPSQNIGTVVNKGIELSANYNFAVGDFNFNIGGNLTTVDNEVTKLNMGQAINYANNRIEVGQPIGYLYGLRFGGIFQSQSEVDNYDTQDTFGSTKAPGDIYFQDLFTDPTTEGGSKEPGPDGVINNSDRTFLGNTIAGHFYGINISAEWRGFDFGVLLQGVGDIQKINSLRWAGTGMGASGENQWVETRNRWTPTNASTVLPRAVEGDPANNNRFSDRWVEDAGFMRLKNIQLGYTFGSKVQDKIGASLIRVYIDGSNLATITNWTGLDPENDAFPLPKIYKVGATISF